MGTPLVPSIDITAIDGSTAAKYWNCLQTHLTKE